LTLNDDSKIGTTLDGEKFKRETRVLKDDKHTIQLGSWDQKFTIRWQPVLLTFQSFTRAEKANGGIDYFRSRLEPLDVKIAEDYYPRDTTHVVATKRNTPKGLLALANANYLVTSAYVDAIERAATSAPNPSDPQNPVPSPLEEDFDTNWPEAMPYVPEAGKEPVQRDAVLFEPDGDRATVFSGYTFVFVNENQYETLSNVVFQAGGKALLFKPTPGETRPDEFVEYVKNTAGEKGLGELEDGSEGRGVVVVRLTEGSPEFDVWRDSFVTNVDLQLNQRSINQNEFLDAIVMKDARPLRKKLEEEVEWMSSAVQPPSSNGKACVCIVGALINGNLGPSAAPLEGCQRQPNTSMKPPPTPSHTQPASAAPQVPPSEQPSTAKRRVRRAVTQSRFKGFDDFDPSQLPKPSPPEDDGEEDVMQGIVDAAPSQSVASPSQSSEGTQKSTQRGRKRQASYDEERQNLMDAILPAATALKRRKLAEREAQGGASDVQQPEEKAIPARDRPRKRNEKEIDVIALARERREAEEEAAAKDAESLREAMEGMDVEDLKRLVQTEEMEIKPRRRPARTQGEDEEGQNDRWDPAWNGRKNFKKFRRRGEPERMRGQRVIVGLEEVKRKGLGIGEEYWLEAGGKSQPQRQSQTQSQAQRRESQGATQIQNEPGSRKKFSRIVEDESGSEPEEEATAIDTDRRSQKESRTQTSRSTGRAESSTAHVATTSSGSKKRSATAASAKAQPPAKKGRFGGRRDDSDDSDEDELKFRFKRKR